MSKYEILVAAYAEWVAALTVRMGGTVEGSRNRHSPFICDCIYAAGAGRKSTTRPYTELVREVSVMICGEYSVVDYLYVTRGVGVGKYVDWIPDRGAPVLGEYDPIVTAFRNGMWHALLEKHKDEGNL